MNNNCDSVVIVVRLNVAIGNAFEYVYKNVSKEYLQIKIDYLKSRMKNDDYTITVYETY